MSRDFNTFGKHSDQISGHGLELRTDVLDVTVFFWSFMLIVRNRNFSAAIINIHAFFQNLFRDKF